MSIVYAGFAITNIPIYIFIRTIIKGFTDFISAKIINKNNSAKPLHEVDTSFLLHRIYIWTSCTNINKYKKEILISDLYMYWDVRLCVICGIFLVCHKYIFLDLCFTHACFTSHLPQFCVSLRRIVGSACGILWTAFAVTWNKYLGEFVPTGDTITLVCNMILYIRMVVFCVFLRLYSSCSGAYVYFWKPSHIYSVWIYNCCHVLLL